MRSEYDFSAGIKNPYARTQKTSVTIRLDKTTVDYFRNLAEEVSIPYQTLINAFLAECAAKRKRPLMIWNED